MSLSLTKSTTFEQMADDFGASASWPTQILVWADILAAHNPGFDRDKFVRRATKKWEETCEPTPDEDLECDEDFLKYLV